MGSQSEVEATIAHKQRRVISTIQSYRLAMLFVAQYEHNDYPTDIRLPPSNLPGLFLMVKRMMEGTRPCVRVSSGGKNRAAERSRCW